MHIEWTGKRCILCLKEGHLSQEHLIPKAIGGILTCRFLCNDCNSRLGRTIEPKVKNDPSIRFAVDALQSDIPDFARRFREGQKFISHGSGPIMQGTLRAGEFRAKSQKTEDGSLIQPTNDARKSIERILEKANVSRADIEKALGRFNELEENKEGTLYPGLKVAKWTTDRLEPDLRGSKPLTPLVPLKIGHEFLALLVGTAIYNQDPALSELRTVLLQGLEDHPSFQVESLHASKYEPFHGTVFVGNSPHAIVLVRLFGWLAFRIHFRGLIINHPSISYLHSLVTNQEDIQVVNRSVDAPRERGQPVC